MDYLHIILLLLSLFLISLIVFLITRWPLKAFTRYRKLERIELEDAIKHLYELGAAGRLVPLNDMAHALGISPHKAGILAGKLIRKCLVIEQGRGNVRLTDIGERRALQIIRAHRIWESYLASKGTAIEDIHEKADRYEHFTKLKEIDEMESDLEYPRRDPHGDLIPNSNGEVHGEEGTPLTHWPPDREAQIVHVEDEPKDLFSQLVAMGLVPGARLEIIRREPHRLLVHSQHLQHILASETAQKIFVVDAPDTVMPLAELLVGEQGIVKEIDESGKPMRRLLDIGLVPGSKVEVVRVAPLGDPFEYRIKGALISLRRHEANKILVKRL